MATGQIVANQVRGVRRQACLRVRVLASDARGPQGHTRCEVTFLSREHDRERVPRGPASPSPSFHPWETEAQELARGRSSWGAGLEAESTEFKASYPPGPEPAPGDTGGHGSERRGLVQKTRDSVSGARRQAGSGPRWERACPIRRALVHPRLSEVPGRLGLSSGPEGRRRCLGRSPEILNPRPQEASLPGAANSGCA